MPASTQHYVLFSYVPRDELKEHTQTSPWQSGLYQRAKVKPGVVLEFAAESEAELATATKTLLVDVYRVYVSIDGETIEHYVGTACEFEGKEREYCSPVYSSTRRTRLGSLRVTTNVSSIRHAIRDRVPLATLAWTHCPRTHQGFSNTKDSQDFQGPYFAVPSPLGYRVPMSTIIRATQEVPWARTHPLVFERYAKLLAPSVPPEHRVEMLVNLLVLMSCQSVYVEDVIGDEDDTTTHQIMSDSYTVPLVVASPYASGDCDDRVMQIAAFFRTLNSFHRDELTGYPLTRELTGIARESNMLALTVNLVTLESGPEHGGARGSECLHATATLVHDKKWYLMEALKPVFYPLEDNEPEVVLDYKTDPFSGYRVDSIENTKANHQITDLYLIADLETRRCFTPKQAGIQLLDLVLPDPKQSLDILQDTTEVPYRMTESMERQVTNFLPYCKGLEASESFVESDHRTWTSGLLKGKLIRMTNPRDPKTGPMHSLDKLDICSAFSTFILEK